MFYQGTDAVKLSSSCKFWVVFRGYGSISAQFSKPLRRYLYLHCVGSPRWPGGDLGGGVPRRSWRRALPAPQTRQSGFSRSFLPSTPFWTWGCAGVQAGRCEKTKRQSVCSRTQSCSIRPVRICSCTRGERRALRGKDRSREASDLLSNISIIGKLQGCALHRQVSLEAGREQVSWMHLRPHAARPPVLGTSLQLSTPCLQVLPSCLETTSRDIPTSREEAYPA